MRHSILARIFGLTIILLLEIGSHQTWAQTPGNYIVDPKTTDGHLKLRRGPNTTYPVVAEIPAGSATIVIAECGARENPSHKPWCKAQWGNFSGWVSSCCILPVSTTAQTATAESEARLVQRDLMWLGYYPGPIDGDIGPGTISAIKNFQTTNNTWPTGSLATTERERLRASAHAAEVELGYSIQTETRTGIRLGVPHALVRVEPSQGRGTKFKAANGSIQIDTFASAGSDLAATFEQFKSGATRVWYSPFRGNWFALAGVENEGTNKERQFFIRAQTDGREIRGYAVQYKPDAHRRIAELISVMSSDFDAFPTLTNVATTPNTGRETSPPTAKNERFDQAASKYSDCLKGEYDRAMAVSVPPQDFARIVSGACVSQSNEVRNASVAMAQNLGLSYDLGSSTGEKSASKMREIIISSYTKRFYEAQAKSAPGQEASATPKENDKKLSSGSGILVSAEGHILTNAHVVDACTTIRSRLADQAFGPASVVAVNKSDDLAIIKVEPRANAKHASFRTAKSVRAGEPILVYGFPLQSILASSGNVSTGIVTALAGLGDNTHHLQISAPVQPGNSGGPLLDESGNVVGIVVAKLGLKAVAYTQDIPQNVNFAIKAPLATSFMDAHGIPYSTAVSEDKRNVPDLSDLAKQFTVNIECNG